MRRVLGKTACEKKKWTRLSSSYSTNPSGKSERGGKVEERKKARAIDLPSAFVGKKTGRSTSYPSKGGGIRLFFKRG